MNAIVEVEAAVMAVQTVNVEVVSASSYIPKVLAPVVSTSTLRVISQGSHSISAVAPDYIFNEGALARA